MILSIVWLFISLGSFYLPYSSKTDHLRVDNPRLSFIITCTTASTQGNYATRDSSGMCHLLPQRNFPEWREEEEREFVHRGSWILNKGLDNTMLATVNCIYMKSFERLCKTREEEEEEEEENTITFRLKCNVKA